MIAYKSRLNNYNSGILFKGMMDQRRPTIADIIRALRLPFVSASALAFIFGSLMSRQPFEPVGFLLGLAAVVGMHLGANLINDYADSRSGADWQDRRYYNFFGGSKLIQEGVLSERFYLSAALLFFSVSLASAIGLLFVLKSLLALWLYLAVLFLGVAYSCPPLKLAYRGCGEIAIFLLFGPALVMGGYFIQTGIFPDMSSFLLSLPLGLLTANILFANEIPDYLTDEKAAKHTLVSLVGIGRAYLLYMALLAGALIAIGSAILKNYISPWAWVSVILLFPGIKAMLIIKRYPGDKVRLIESSKTTIAIQGMAAVILIVSVLI